MNTPSVTNHGGVEQLFQSLTGDAAIDQGAPVALDVAKIAAATSTKGLTIGDYNAVAAFIAELTTANAPFYQGIAEKAFAAGDKKRIVSWGPTRARVRNASAASVTLPVGTLLYTVPAADYLVPVTSPTGDTPTFFVCDALAMPRAMIRKAVTILTVTTQLCEVFVFPPSIPRIERIGHYLGASATATIFLGVARGYGRILRAGIGSLTNGSVTNTTMDVLINATSIFSTIPGVHHDHVEPFHGFKSVGATTAGPGGTDGTYGVLKAAASLELAPGDFLTMTFTQGSSADQAGVRGDVDILYY